MKTRICGSVGTLVVAMWALIYAAPPIYGSLWRLVRGGSVQCRGFVVPVPQNWWAKDHGCSLTTASPEYTLLTHRPVQLFLGDPVAATADSFWESDVVARLKQHGIAAYRITEVSVGGIPTTCFEFRTPDSKDGSNIACNVHRHMVAILYYYDDDPKMKNEFYEILAKIRPVGRLR